LKAKFIKENVYPRGKGEVYSFLNRLLHYILGLVQDVAVIILRDFRFSQQCWWWFKSSAMFCHVNW